VHTDNPSPRNDHIVAYLVADDPPAADWLEDMGVVAINENGAWRLTALGEVAMARFNGRYAQNQCFVSNVFVAPAADAPP